MAALLLKIALGLFACVVAVLGVSDLKTVSPETTPKESWIRRLTPIGIVKIACALATLLLLGANEWVTYRTTAESAATAAQASKRAQDDSQKLQSKLDEARKGLLATIVQLRTLSRTNDYLVTTLYSSLVRAGIARVPAEEIESRQYPLSFEGGADLTPKPGDSFEWSIVCQGKLLPIPTSEQDGNCSQAGYGRLMAGGSSVLLTEASGRRPYFGTRSTGEQMTYRSPAENGWCPPTAAKMKSLGCELDVTVMREARWKFEDLKKTQTIPEHGSAQDEIMDVCRTYEALYGESCDAAIERQTDHK